MSRSSPQAEHTVSIPLSALLGSGAVTVVAPPPEMVSQRTVEALFGIPSRTFLDHVVPMLRASGVPVVSLGKLRLVAHADLVAHFRKLGSAAPEPAPSIGAAAGDATLAEIAAAAAPSNTNSARRRAAR